MAKILKSGFTKEEEIQILRFCLSGDWPSTLIMERTRTIFTLENERGAARLYRAIAPTQALKVFGPPILKSLSHMPEILKCGCPVIHISKDEREELHSFRCKGPFWTPGERISRIELVVSNG